MSEQDTSGLRVLRILIETCARMAKERSPWTGWGRNTVRSMPDRYRHLGNRYLPLRHLWLSNFLWLREFEARKLNSEG